MPPEKKSKNYRAFALGKLIRDGIAIHAMNLGGEVYARYPKGMEGLIAHLRKMREELCEVDEARKLKSNLPEEIIDCLGEITLFRYEYLLYSAQMARIEKLKAGQVPDILQKLDALEQCIQAWPDIPQPWVEGLLHRLAWQTHGYLARLVASPGGLASPGSLVTPSELADALTQKLHHKGAYNGLYADVIVLPRSRTKWCAVLASKFPEVSPDIFDSATAFTLENLRHPQG